MCRSLQCRTGFCRHLILVMLCKIDKVDFCKGHSGSSVRLKRPGYSYCVIHPHAAVIHLPHALLSFLPSLHPPFSLSGLSFQSLILCGRHSGMKFQLPFRNEGLIRKVCPWLSALFGTAWPEDSPQAYFLSKGSPYPVTA